MTRDTTLQGVILMLAFCVIAPLLDVGAKLAAENGIPVGQITTARFVVQTALMLPVVLVMRLSMTLSAKALAYTTLRALLLLPVADELTAHLGHRRAASAAALTDPHQMQAEARGDRPRPLFGGERQDQAGELGTEDAAELALGLGTKLAPTEERLAETCRILTGGDVFP